MCGRFYVDDEMINEIEKILKRIDGQNIKKGEVFPTDKALVIKDDVGTAMKWGYNLGEKNKVIFNARSETIDEKPLFRKDFMERRCVIPVRGFYEWNKEKEKFYFTLPDSKVMYLAGLYREDKDTGQFTIITTGANEEMKKIHDRMPVILGSEEIKMWVAELKEAYDLLRKDNPELTNVSCNN